MGRTTVTKPQQTIEAGARVAHRCSRDRFAEHALHEAVECLNYTFSLIESYVILDSKRRLYWEVWSLGVYKCCLCLFLFSSVIVTVTTTVMVMVMGLRLWRPRSSVMIMMSYGYSYDYEVFEFIDSTS